MDKILYKILESIFKEKEDTINIAIFFGSLASLLSYLYTSDLMLTMISFFMVFSIFKVISKILLLKLLENRKRSIQIKNFSSSELKIINQFIKAGSCFLSINNIKKGCIPLDEAGLDSLISRGIIEFQDIGGGLGAGYYFDKDLYISLLKFYKSNNGLDI